MGASVPIIGGMAQAYALQQEAEAQANQLGYEKNMYLQNSKEILKNAKFNANRQQMESEQIFGAIKAGYAASGVESNTGSPLEILRQSYTNAETDRLTILRQGDVQAKSARNRASAIDSQISALETTKTANQIASILGGFGRARGMS